MLTRKGWLTVLLVLGLGGSYAWLALVLVLGLGCSSSPSTQPPPNGPRRLNVVPTPGRPLPNDDDLLDIPKPSSVEPVALAHAYGPELAPFRGKVAEPIKWDLWGDWEIVRTAREDGQEGAPGRWQESWHPRPREDKTMPLWLDPQRGEVFVLVPGNGKMTGDRLRWRRYRGKIFDFSVNRQSYGLLVMTDQDGEIYLAVRQEGGDKDSGEKPSPRWLAPGRAPFPPPDLDNKEVK